MSCCLLDSCTASSVPAASAATTSTGRSFPRPSFSSNGTQVQTTSPGSGAPSVDGEYVIRTAPICRGSTSTVADGPVWPGELGCPLGAAGRGPVGWRVPLRAPADGGRAGALAPALVEVPKADRSASLSRERKDMTADP